MKLVVRPVTTADWPAVRRISSRIWEGRDYVLLFFRQWVREGGFWCGTRRGRVVGYGKTTELAPGEWWLEGLRVDPDCRHRGIGAELSRQVLYRALDERPTSLRLATSDSNHDLVRIIEDAMHLRVYVRFRSFTMSPNAEGRSAKSGLRYSLAPGEPGRARKLHTPSAGEALEFLHRSPEFVAGRGLIQASWHFREAGPRYLAELRRSGSLYGFRRQGRLEGLLILVPHRYRGANLEVPFIGGTRQAIAAFGAFIHRRAREAGSETVNGMAASREMEQAFVSIGARPHERGGAVLVYEYPV
jgi:GNAT superfamily N-acetyltransferase